MADAYASLYALPSTGLRFFTVYGPYGRPDMAYFSFVKSILEKKQISIYNYGKMKRDFTYVDDIVESIYRLLEKPPSTSGGRPARVLNIGRGEPSDLMEFIQIIEELLGEKAIIEKVPMQQGDVPATWADNSKLVELCQYSPKVSLKEGLSSFVNWYKKYYS